MNMIALMFLITIEKEDLIGFKLSLEKKPIVTSGKEKTKNIVVKRDRTITEDELTEA